MNKRLPVHIVKRNYKNTYLHINRFATIRHRMIGDLATPDRSIWLYVIHIYFSETVTPTDTTFDKDNKGE